MELHFHFIRNLHASQIQLFAKVVRCCIRGEFSEDYCEWIQFELPQEVKDCKYLIELCSTHKSDECFYISTPNYSNIEYYVKFVTQIPNLDISLHLSRMQGIFNDFKANSFQTSYHEVANRLLMAFICINNGISSFFVNHAYENGAFSWKVNYRPCFFNLDYCRELLGRIDLISFDELQGEITTPQLHDTAKVLLVDFLYQCGYLTFWSCLADVSTFPNNSPQEKEVLGNLIAYLLKHYMNIYVYNLTVETKAIQRSDNVRERGSSSNTTRIKLYFTRDDDTPVLMRLDLPHVDYPYVHLNVQEGEENIHVKLSKEVVEGEYDHVFENLGEALRQYNFNTAEYIHSPVELDKQTIRDMRYRTALLKYAPHAFYCQMLDSIPASENLPSVMHAKDTLIELLTMDNFKREELMQMAPPDILELAYKEIFVN